MKLLGSSVKHAVNALLVAALTMMVVLTFVDVIGRRLFNTPVFGANDVTEHLMAVIVFAGLPLLTGARAHLSIDLFDKWLLRPGLNWWHKVVDILIAAVLALMAWEFFVAIGDAQSTKEVSQALSIPRAWMYAFMAVACAIAAVAALFVGPPQHHQPGEEEF